jgi:hypothetical protein
MGRVTRNLWWKRVVATATGAAAVVFLAGCGSSGGQQGSAGSTSPQASPTLTARQTAAQARALARAGCVLNDREAARLVPSSAFKADYNRITMDFLTAEQLDPRWLPLANAMHKFILDADSDASKHRLAVDAYTVIQDCNRQAHIGYIPPGTPGKKAGPDIRP